MVKLISTGLEIEKYLIREKMLSDRNETSMFFPPRKQRPIQSVLYRLGHGKLKAQLRNLMNHELMNLSLNFIFEHET